MKRLLSIAVILLFATGCKKEDPNKTNCWECKNLNGSASFQDAGCMTNAQWDGLQFTDPAGNTLNKDENCRKR